MLLQCYIVAIIHFQSVLRVAIGIFPNMLSFAEENMDKSHEDQKDSLGPLAHRMGDSADQSDVLFTKNMEDEHHRQRTSENPNLQ